MTGVTGLELGETIALLAIAAHVVLGFVATVLVSANRRPSAAIAWVLCIVFIPFLGAVAFLLVGRSRLPAGRRAAQREMNARLVARVPDASVLTSSAAWPSSLPSIVRLNTHLGALPMTGGNRVALTDSYGGSLAAMTDAVDGARSFVHVEFYILVLDDSTRPFFESLARAVARGVTVRVLSDHLSGFLGPARRSTQEFMVAAGIRWQAMLPLRPLKGQWQRPDLRNHRKLVVIDGAVGFTGSQNLIDASYLKAKNVARGLQWHEVMMRLEGAAVRELDAVFVTDWFSETGDLLPLEVTVGEVRDIEVVAAEVAASDAAGLAYSEGAAPGASGISIVDAQVVPSGPGFDNDNNLKLFAALIHNAERRVSITSPYFVPDDSILLAIITAASRGLDVELFVSEEGDQVLVHHAQRSYYEALLRAGVAIWLYPPPTVLHSKHFSVDDSVAVVGSSNMDIRSFSLNLEVSVMVHGRAFVRRLRAIEDSSRAASRRLTLEEWLARPVRGKVVDSLARLTSSLQ